MFFFSSRRRHTRYWRDWSSDVCSSDLTAPTFSLFFGAGKAVARHTASISWHCAASTTVWHYWVSVSALPTGLVRTPPGTHGPPRLTIARYTPASFPKPWAILPLDRKSVV